MQAWCITIMCKLTFACLLKAKTMCKLWIKTAGPTTVTSCGTHHVQSVKSYAELRREHLQSIAHFYQRWASGGPWLRTYRVTAALAAGEAACQPWQVPCCASQVASGAHLLGFGWGGGEEGPTAPARMAAAPPGCRPRHPPPCLVPGL